MREENAGYRSNKLMSLLCLSLMSFALSGCGRTPGSQTVYDYNTGSGTPGYTGYGGTTGGYDLGAPPYYGGGVGPWHYSQPTQRVYRSSRSWTRTHRGPNGTKVTVKRTRTTTTTVRTTVKTRLRYPSYGYGYNAQPVAYSNGYSNGYAYAPQTAAAGTLPAAATGTAANTSLGVAGTANPAAGTIPGDNLGNLTASNVPTGAIPTGATPVAAAPLSTPMTAQLGPGAPAADPTLTPGVVPASAVTGTLPS